MTTPAGKYSIAQCEQKIRWLLAENRFLERQIEEAQSALRYSAVVDVPYKKQQIRKAEAELESNKRTIKLLESEIARLNREQ